MLVFCSLSRVHVDCWIDVIRQRTSVEICIQGRLVNESQLQLNRADGLDAPEVLSGRKAMDPLLQLSLGSSTSSEVTSSNGDFRRPRIQRAAGDILTATGSDQRDGPLDDLRSVAFQQGCSLQTGIPAQTVAAQQSLNSQMRVPGAVGSTVGRTDKLRNRHLD